MHKCSTCGAEVLQGRSARRRVGARVASWLVVAFSLSVFLGGAVGGYLYRVGAWSWPGGSIRSVITDAQLQPLPLPSPAAQDEERWSAVVHVHPKSAAGQKEGMGFFIDGSGHMITAAHVVEGERCVSVQGQDGRNYPGTVLGIDRVLDVALVRVASAGAPHAFIAVASGVAPAAGAPVSVVTEASTGNGWTEHSGKVERPAVDLSVDERYLTGVMDLGDVQAAPGMSGGPVVNPQSGKAIGLLVAGTQTGGGYAVPLYKAAQRLSEWTAMATPAGCERSPVATATEVQIATINPLSGLMGVWGADVADGAELALREMEAELQAVGLRVSLRRLDDGGSPDQAKEQAILIAADPRVIGVVGSLTNPLSDAVRAGLAESKKVQIIPATPAETPYKGEGRPPFRLVPAVQEQMASLLATMRLQQPVETVLLLADGTALGEARVGLFGEVAARHGVRVIDRISLHPDVTPAAVFSRIAEQRPDVVYFGGNAGSLRETLAAIGGRSWRLAGGAELADRGFEALPPAVTEGMLFPYPVRAPAASFSTRFESVLGKPTAGLSAYGYDATRLILDGLVAWGTDHPGQAPDADQLYQWIQERARHQGVMGRIGFQPNGENGDATIPIYRWSGGALQLVTKG
jgi:branched-chain amino acid transport system substrate-binding protein